MAENRLFEKKLEDYKAGEMNNFVGENELVVTITLNEYRELVSEVARKKADIDEMRNAKWKAENENAKLKEEISELRQRLADLLCKYNEGVAESA